MFEFAKGLCADCVEEEAALPSIESFGKRLELPKVNYIFYEYFFKAVMGESEWKRRLETRQRMGTSIMEAFAHGTLQNNYFAWLLDYRLRHPNSGLTTEYDIMETEEGEDEEMGVYCGDLRDIEIALPTETKPQYKLITNTDGQEFKDAEEASKLVMEDAERIAKSERGHKRSFEVMKGKEKAFGSENMSDNATRDKKRQCMREMKPFTGYTPKTKKGQKRGKKISSLKGWSEEGKKFVAMVKEEIMEEVNLGTHGKWEKSYRKICSLRQETGDRVSGDDESSPVEMREEVWYAEL